MSPFGAAATALGVLERRFERGLVVAVVAVFARSGDRRDDAGGLVDAPDALVVRVGDDQIAVGRDRDAVRRIELRRDGEPVVAGESAARIVIAGHRLDRSCCAHRCAG